ncbi:MAG TPA: purine-binding chemotaxis protein CheW [Sedimenticola thiotaurini]|uniref:Chemotaxis protein CheW n=1 Tax=Sedimenticola thiotaurini TaxID=1543721 RepID=A0A831RHH8_9GAMM|nr:purine-binding chemotaxis protein CheW [Sedimenticola thiotaurini]
MNAESTIARNHQDTGGAEYLSFRLGDEGYGVDILKVQEIRGWEPVTRVPNAPDYVRGVLNLRGAIVPVFDLRRRLGMEPVAYGKETVVIVVRVQGEEESKSIGLVVDAVSDVMRVTSDSIRATPEFGARLDTGLITGMVTAGERMVMLLDVEGLHQAQAADPATEVGAA